MAKRAMDRVISQELDSNRRMQEKMLLFNKRYAWTGKLEKTPDGSMIIECSTQEEQARWRRIFADLFGLEKNDV